MLIVKEVSIPGRSPLYKTYIPDPVHKIYNNLYENITVVWASPYTPEVYSIRTKYPPLQVLYTNIPYFKNIDAFLTDIDKDVKHKQHTKMLYNRYDYNDYM